MRDITRHHEKANLKKERSHCGARFADLLVLVHFRLGLLSRSTSSPAAFFGALTVGWALKVFFRAASRAKSIEAFLKSFPRCFLYLAFGFKRPDLATQKYGQTSKNPGGGRGCGGETSPMGSMDAQRLKEILAALDGDTAVHLVLEARA